MFWKYSSNVEFVEVVNNRLVFLTKKTLKLHRAVSVRLNLQSFWGEKQTVNARLFLHETRPARDGNWTYVGSLLSQLPFRPNPNFDARFGPLRKAPRLHYQLRVVSLVAPTFAGSTTDFSRTGLQLQTSQQLTPGRVTELRIYPPQVKPPHVKLDSILLEARVAWCRQQEDGGYRAGLEFRHLSSPTREQLERLERFVHLQEKLDCLAIEEPVRGLARAD